MGTEAASVGRAWHARTFNSLLDNQALPVRGGGPLTDDHAFDEDFSLLGPRVPANGNMASKSISAPRFKRPVPIQQPQSRLTSAAPPVVPYQVERQDWAPQKASTPVRAAYVPPRVESPVAVTTPAHGGLPASAPKTMLQLQNDIPVAIRQKSLDMQQRQQRLVIQVNQALPQGCTILPWQPIPLAVFEGDLGKFLLMACDFQAHGHGNTVFLPALPAGVEQLEMPRHPFMVTERHAAVAKQKVIQLRDRVAREHADISKAMSRGDMSRLLKASDHQRAYRKQMFELAAEFAKEALGATAWKTHEMRFRALIDAM